MEEKNCKCPSFFKVLLYDFTTTLKVPPAFVKNFGAELPEIIILKSFSKKSWGVLMEKKKEGLFFTKGWSKFVKEHSLEYGNFLIFKFTTNSSFEVVIYGHDNCEKETPIGSQQPDPVSEEKKNKKKQQPQTTTRAGVGCSKSSNNLQFVRNLTNDDTQFNIWLPSKFAKATGLVSKDSVILKDVTEGGTGGEWNVELRRQKDVYGRVQLTTGWHKFRKAKNLCCGQNSDDSCLFEFVDGCIHVTIFKNGAAEKPS
ncbi:hypothetical protein ACFE04_024356 [Oxalis oulophora]